MGALTDMVTALYKEKPKKTLFHYTSLAGMMGIVTSRHLWASEIRYVNDANELGQFKDWIQGSGPGAERVDANIRWQFLNWVSDRLRQGPLLFLGCFTENGNLLSQWRGYCATGNGISLGFRPAALEAVLTPRNFRIGKCIYDMNNKKELVRQAVDIIISTARDRGEDKKSPSSQSYYPIFAELEEDILAIAALMKAHYFHEEEEWRVVSPAYSNYVTTPVKYRQGVTTLIPYLEMPLPEEDAKLALEVAIVGPTPSISMTMSSVRMYLSKYASCPGLVNSQIPYREC